MAKKELKQTGLIEWIQKQKQVDPELNDTTALMGNNLCIPIPSIIGVFAPNPKFPQNKSIMAPLQKVCHIMLGTKEGGYDGLLQYQREIREAELVARHKKETDPWDEDLKQVPPLPKD